MFFAYVGNTKISIDEFIKKMESNQFFKENDIWISDENHNYPCLSILINDKYVVLHFFKDADDVGCISLNENKDKESAYIAFGDICLNSIYAVDLQNAIDCITEFVGLKIKPTKIKWIEL